MIIVERFRALKINVPDMPCCTIWEVTGDDEYNGPSFEFRVEDIALLIDVLNQLQECEGEEYIP